MGDMEGRGESRVSSDTRGGVLEYGVDYLIIHKCHFISCHLSRSDYLFSVSSRTSRAEPFVLVLVLPH
jgi:hypothetical protein